MKYNVTLVERYSFYHTLSIEADSEQAAKEKALELIAEAPSDPEEIVDNSDYDLEVIDMEAS